MIIQTTTFFALPGLTKLFGHQVITAASVAAIGVRFIVYSMTVNQWWMVFADSLKGKSAKC